MKTLIAFILLLCVSATATTTTGPNGSGGGGGGGVGGGTNTVTFNGATYSTITAAVNAADAVGGGTVFVNPGIYQENDLARNNVTIWCSGPQTVISNIANFWNNTGASSTNALFDDSTHGATNFALMGKPTLYFNAGTNVFGYVSVPDIPAGIGATNALYGIRMTNSASVWRLTWTDFHFSSHVLSGVPSAVSIQNCAYVSCDFDNLYDDAFANPYTYLSHGVTPHTFGSSSAGLNSIVGTEQHFNFKHIYTFGQYAITWEQTPGTVVTNNFYYTGNEVNARVYGAGVVPSYRAWIDIKWINDLNTNESVAALTLLNPCYTYVNAQKISTSFGTPPATVSVTGGATLWLKADKIEGTNTLFQVDSNPTNSSFVNVQQWTELSTASVTNGINIQGGTNVIDGGYMKINGGPGIIAAGGTNYFKNLTVDTTGGGTTNCVPFLITASSSNYVANCSFQAKAGTISAGSPGLAAPLYLNGTMFIGGGGTLGQLVVAGTNNMYK